MTSPASLSTSPQTTAIGPQVVAHLLQHTLMVPVILLRGLQLYYVVGHVVVESAGCRQDRTCLVSVRGSILSNVLSAQKHSERSMTGRDMKKLSTYLSSDGCVPLTDRAPSTPKLAGRSVYSVANQSQLMVT